MTARSFFPDFYNVDLQLEVPELCHCYLCLQGFLQQLRQIAGRMSSGPRGAGLGVKLLIGAGAVAYGLKEAMYTGKSSRSTSASDTLVERVKVSIVTIDF